MPAALPLIGDDDLRTRRKPVSILQLARYLGLTRRTLYNHRDKGALAVVKVGGTLLVPAKEARRYAGLSEPKPAKKLTASTRRRSPARRQFSVASV
jgi:excisionase family DNA binding protein